MKNKKRFDLAVTELNNVERHLKKSFLLVREIGFLSKDTQKWYEKEVANLLIDTRDLMSKIKFFYNSENPDKPKPKVII